MVSLYFIGGLLFANLGILGIYIVKIFDETKKRPIYLIQDATFDARKAIEKSGNANNMRTENDILPAKDKIDAK